MSVKKNPNRGRLILSLSDMDRAEAVKFKLMPDGHIRGVQTQRPDLASATEWMIYFTNACAPTITAVHTPKLLITDEAIQRTLFNSLLR